VIHQAGERLGEFGDRAELLDELTVLLIVVTHLTTVPVGGGPRRRSHSRTRSSSRAAGPAALSCTASATSLSEVAAAGRAE
jgi:hypothetical protein